MVFKRVKNEGFQYLEIDRLYPSFEFIAYRFILRVQIYRFIGLSGKFIAKFIGAHHWSLVQMGSITA